MGVRTASIRQAQKQIPEGGVGNVIETVFYVEDDGPFILDHPAEGFDPIEARNKVHEFADKIRAAREAITETAQPPEG